MKRLFPILLLLSSLITRGQNQISPITITLKSNPAANVIAWAASLPPFTITAQTQLEREQVPVAVSESRILVTIKQGGVIVCGDYNKDNAPRSNFNKNKKSWIGPAAVALLGKGCTLEPGIYELCVQFYGVTQGMNGVLLGEACRSFTVGDKKQQGNNEIKQPQKDPVQTSPPKNELPAEGKNFTQQDIKQPIQFKWAGVTPTGGNEITYTLRVYHIGKGQTTSQALKENKPVFETRVNTMQTNWLVPRELTISKETQKFTWNVQATARSGANLGYSEPTSFTTGSDCSPQYDLVVESADCGPDGKVHVTGHITIQPPPTVTISQIQITAIKESNFSGVNISTSISLALPLTLTASGNNYPFSFIVNDNMCNKQLFIAYNITSYCSLTGITTVIPCAAIIPMPCCTCTYCDKYTNWTFSTGSLTATTTAPYTVNLTTSITNPNLSITSFKAELVKFVHNAQEECMGCNKNSQSFSNFTGGTFGIWGNGVFPLHGTNTTHHTLSWFGLPGSSTSLNSPINLTFTVPPFNPLRCCDDEIQFCIRYSFTDKDCRTCSFVKCYTVKRRH